MMPPADLELGRQVDERQGGQIMLGLGGRSMSVLLKSLGALASDVILGLPQLAGHLDR